MFYSELLKGEKLRYAVAPVRISKLDRVYVSIRGFVNTSSTHHRGREESPSGDAYEHATKHSTVLTYLRDDILFVERVGELFTVYHEIGDGEWLWARSIRTGAYGFLLAECVRCVV